MSDDNPSPSPNRPRRDDSIPLSVWTRIDEICDRFEQAWNAEESPKLDDYLVSDLPANQLRALFAALLTVELDRRRAAGQEPTVDEYHQRFADHVVEVDKCFASVSRTIAPAPGEQVRYLRPSITRRVGPYKLLQRIGEGGMGTVWMAQQEQPVRRRVALKLIKGGQNNKQVIARFEAERQALAMMDHQNIAKVLDAGTADDGSPYFVMELVQGDPITTYCDRNKLTPRERLELFIPVCRAVQHADQKGIIHRDLKPSNVLVQIYDGKPMAKVIDFGLAKALQHQTKLTDKTVFTEFGQVVGTVQYMSPEQARLDAIDIDTRTDIYSLGVMLYELLTGSTPLDQETAKKQALLQVLQIIREQEPPRPSQRLSSSGHKISEISKQRNIESHQLQKILRGDLDWIIMKSLEKDRTRRYATANDFAQDVQRYIQGDAVEARPPTTAYRVSKFVRKNRGLVVTTVTIMALLLAGIATSSWFAVKADRAATTAKAALKSAEEQKNLAEQQAKRADAEAERARIAQAATNAEQERTKQALAESESTLARSNYWLAGARWNEHRAADAMALLDSIPTQYRNFECYRDRRRFLGSDVTCYGHQAYVTSVAFSPDGSRIVSGSYNSTLKLWDARNGAEIQTLRGHTSGVSSVAFSPDGSRIVSGSEDNTLKLWDARSGAEIQTLKGHTRPVTSVAVSPDGSRIVSGSGDSTLKLWDARSGAEIQTLKGHTSGVRSVAFSPDGSRIVSGSGDSTLKLWDARSGAEIQTLKGHTSWVRSVAFSPDGSRIVSGSEDSTLKLWDARNGAEIQTLQGHTGRVSSVAFSPDGSRIVSGSDDSTLKLWDARNGAEIQTLRGHTSGVSSVAFSPDGSRIFSGSEDNTLKLWDARSGAEIQTLKGHTRPVTSVAFSPDGSRIVSGSWDSTLKLWDARSGAEIQTLQGHTGLVTSVAFSPDGSRIVSGSGDNALKLWDARSGAEIQTLQGHTDQVWSVAFSPDGSRIVSGSEDSTLKLWDARSGAEIQTLQGHTGLVTSVAFSPDGSRIVSGSGDNTLKLWDARTGVEIQTLAGHTSSVSSVAFSPDGSRIVSGSGDSTLKLWDARSGTEIQTLKGHTDQVWSVAFSPDGSRIVSGSWDCTLKLWDARSGAEIQTLQGHTGRVSSVAFSPDGSRIVSGSGDSTLKLWDARSGAEIQTLKGHTGWVSSVAFSPDGSRIVSGSEDNTLKLWDARSGAEIQTLKGHTRPVTSVAFSPDGSRIVSGSWDSTLKLWDARSGAEIQTLKGHTGGVSSVAFSPDGSRIVSGSDDNALKLWDARSGAEIQTLQGHTGRVSSVAFSFDGSRIYSKSERGNEKFAWDAKTGERLVNESFESGKDEPSSHTSPNGRWLVVPSGNNVLLVDREFKNQPDEKAYRDAKARLDPLWHSQQAELAEQAKDWYAATFHWAWALSAKPDSAGRYYRFHAAHQQLVTRYGDEKMLLGNTTVQKALSLPSGDEVPLYDAQIINSKVWQKVVPTDGKPTKFDLKFMRLVCEKYPMGIYWNTLAVAEYRLGNFQEAIDAAHQSLEKTPKQKGYDSPHPIDVAILAMSYFKLGDIDNANKYRKQLSEVMQLDRWKNDPECKSFVAEVDKLFDAAEDAGDQGAKPSEEAPPAGQEPDAANPE